MIFDLHNDTLTSELTQHDKRSEITDYSANNNLHGAIFALWTDKRYSFLQFESLINESISLIEKSALSNKNKFFLSVEDLHFVTERNIEQFLEFPFISCNLTWNDNNGLAGGAFGDGHLTQLGALALAKLCDRNKLIDLAHLNRTSFFEVIDKCNDNIWVTHTSINEKFVHPRNLSDEQIKLVIERGGLIGLTLVSSFMTEGKADISEFAKLIEFFVDRYGAKNLAIGTDFFGTTNGIIGLDSYLKFDYLQYLLTMNGMSGESVSDIFWQNSIKFLQKHNITF